MRYLFLCFSLLVSLASFSKDNVLEVDSVGHPVVTLEDVVIVSSKVDQTILKVPSAVSKLSLTDMKSQNLTEVKDFSGVMPNLYIPDYGSKLTSPVYIRGIGSRINAPSIGLYVDGVPYFEKSVFDFDLNEVASVEVLRGPQGTLYGRNTMGGIINVYTKDPLKYQGLQLKQTIGNYGQSNSSLSYYTKINEKLGVSVSGNYNYKEGYFKNTFTNQAVDMMNQVSSRIKLHYKPSDVTDVVGFVNYEYLDQGGYPYALYHQDGSIAPINYNEFSSYRRQIFTSGLTIKHKFAFSMLKAVTGYQYHDDKQAIDQDFTTKPMYFVTQAQNKYHLSQELELHSTTDSKYQWLNGAFLFMQDGDREVEVNEKIQKRYAEPIYGLALYHQSTLNDFLINNLSLSVGLRYDVERQDQDYRSLSLVDGKWNLAKEMDDHKTFVQLTPHFSALYSLSPKQSFYATIKRGYKTGGFNTTFDTEEERTFDPEYSWNYEVGTKFSYFDGKFTGDFTLFYIDWRNQQTSHPIATGRGNMLVNAGKSYSKGLELSLGYQPTSALSFKVNYGYTKAKFLSYKGKEDYSGKLIPYVPNQTLMASANYQLKIKDSSLLDKIDFGVQYLGTGKVYFTDNNSFNQPFYGVLNGQVAFSKKYITLKAWIKNATSKDYIAYHLSSLHNDFVQTGKPLTWGVTLSMLF